MQKLPLAISVAVAIVIIGGAVMFSGTPNAEKKEVQNVSMESAVQVIEITAKGGYSPQRTVARAGIPTIIRMKTDSTYDCSASVSIPLIAVTKILEPTGVTDIAVSPEYAQGTLAGVCAMGMYNFSVLFI